MPNLPKNDKNTVCWAGEKHKDEHDEIKLHLHCNWLISSFNDLVRIMLAAPMEKFFYYIAG